MAKSESSAFAKIFARCMKKAGRSDSRALYWKYKTKYEELTGSDTYIEFSRYKTMGLNKVYACIVHVLMCLELGYSQDEAVELWEQHAVKGVRGLLNAMCKAFDLVPGEAAYKVIAGWLYKDAQERIEEDCLTYDMLDYSDDRLEYNITRCAYVDLFERYGIRDACKAFCNNDLCIQASCRHARFVRYSDLIDGPGCHDAVVNVASRNARKTLYPKSYEKTVRKWLADRYGRSQMELVWDKTLKKYNDYLLEAPDYGGTKNGHSMSIYGSMLVFALVDSLPDQPAFGELQELTQTLFMEPFMKLGKLFDLNRRADMAIMDKVFRNVAKRDRKESREWPCGFHTAYDGFDKQKQSTSYHFTQCPVAEFAKKHNMLKVLPLMCNCDYFGIEQIHGKLIREGTCGISDRCDYLIVGSNNPVANEYETAADENGLLISVRKAK